MKVFVDQVEVKPEEAPYIQDWYDQKSLTVTTNGTSGHPKTIVHSYETMRQVTEAMIKAHNIDKNSKMFCLVQPKSIAYHSLFAFMAAEVGCELHVESFNPFTYIDRIHDIRPTYTVMVPAIWRSLHRSAKWESLDLSSLDTVIMGADFIPSGALDEIRTHGPNRVVGCYGSTEVPPTVLISADENSYNASDVPEGVQLDVSSRGTLLCKWSSQRYWWDSEDLIEGDVKNTFTLKGRERNMFKQRDVRVYPEHLEKTAVDLGAQVALCQNHFPNAVLYYQGDMDVSKFKEEYSYVPGLRVQQAEEILIDTNLGKVIRNQNVKVK